MAREDTMQIFGRPGCLGRSQRIGKEMVLNRAGGSKESQERP